MSNDYSARAFLSVLGVTLVAAFLPELRDPWSASRVVLLALLTGVFCLLAAFPLWTLVERKLPLLSGSFVRLGSDARWWVGLILAFAIYAATTNIMLLRQRDDLSDVIEKDITPFRLALQRYVLPRRMTPEQIAKVAEHLKKYPPSTVNFSIAQYDDEASQFRVDIQQAIQGAGWTVGTFDYQTTVDPGFGLHLMQTMESAQKKPDPRQPMPSVLLLEAFRLAGVPFDRNGGGHGVDVTHDTLTIRVGRRRMDANARPQPWDVNR